MARVRPKRVLILRPVLYEASLVDGESVLGGHHFFAFGVELGFEGDSLKFFGLFYFQFLSILFGSLLFPLDHLIVVCTIVSNGLRSPHMAIELLHKNSLLLFLLLLLHLLDLFFFLLLGLQHLLVSIIDGLMTHVLCYLLRVLVDGWLCSYFSLSEWIDRYFIC